MALNKYLGFFYIYFEIDYMLEYIFLGVYLLLLVLYLYLLKIDEKYINYNYNYNNINNNSQNNKLPVIRNYTEIQSAENCNIFYKFHIYLINIMDNKYIIPNRNKGFSETIRQLFSLSKNNQSLNKDLKFNNSVKDQDSENIKFWKWLAGILDGDGSFDVRKENNIFKLKEIRIKLHERDVRILTRIQNTLHIGKIRKDKRKPYVIYSVCRKADMLYIFNNINGFIRLKLKNFKFGCEYLNLKYIEPNYTLEAYDPYFSGLIDTDGSIVYNYTGNRIECNLELKYNENSSKLNLENVIPNYKPVVYLRTKHIKSIPDKEYQSITFKYQNVKGMVYLYDFFLKNRLYSDFKFYRVTKIKRFIEIRDYQKSKELIEFQIYKDFILDWIQYKNPLWYKVPFINKLNKDRVQN